MLYSQNKFHTVIVAKIIKEILDLKTVTTLRFSNSNSNNSTLLITLGLKGNQVKERSSLYVNLKTLSNNKMEKVIKIY